MTTVASAGEACTLAEALVRRKLAACVQTMPIISCYEWQGAVHHDAEHLLLIKTPAARYPAVEAAIRELHAYDVPEIIAIPIAAGSVPYLAWLDATATG